MSLVAKLRLYPDAGQADALLSAMRAYRDGCNMVSRHVFRTRCLVQRELHDRFYVLLRSNHGLKSQMAESVVRTVIARYRAAQDMGHPWSLVVFKAPQIDLVRGRDYSWIAKQGDLLSINTLLPDRIKVPFLRRGMEQWMDLAASQWGTAKVVFKHGKWFLHVPMTFEAPDLPMSEVKNVCGVDRGVRFHVAAYDSKGRTQLISGKEEKQYRSNAKERRSELQRKGTPSARRRLKAIGSRENRHMQDVNHCVAKALVESQPEGTLFVLEDLSGIRSATERVRKRSRYVQVSWPFWDLGKKIEYKAQRRGSAVVQVDPAHTSQTCPKCGHTEKGNRDKHSHTFRCKACGYQSNDDRVAAMNLHRKGIEHVAACSAST